ncbi:hypothetical protein GCM10027290_65400 [Micromonospora sonneratiae]|uniref:WD40 repeat domain-containing protein n=1 Tax=Micromonospora sonneratiae TaxID=1184706 RepID=UPI00366AB2B1
MPECGFGCDIDGQKSLGWWVCPLSTADDCGSLRDAQLAGSRWDRAALLGTYGWLDLADSVELTAAAIPGRDPVTAQILPAGSDACVAYSPDGALMAIGRGSSVEIVDRTDNRTIRILTGHTGWVTAVAYSPDGTQLATTSWTTLPASGTPPPANTPPPSPATPMP